MDLSQEPDELKLSEVFNSSRSQLINLINRVSTIEDLEIASCSLADAGSIFFQNFRAFENNNSTISDAYGNSFLDFYGQVNHDRFNPRDALIFFTVSNDIFTMSDSDYIDLLEENKDVIVQDYIQALIDGTRVMAIPDWYEVLNQYIIDYDTDSL